MQNGELLKSTTRRGEIPGTSERTMDNTTYLRGNKARYTGTITPNGWHEVVMLEGPDAGKIKVTLRGPDGVNPFASTARKEYAEAQAQFRKLNGAK